MVRTPLLVLAGGRGGLGSGAARQPAPRPRRAAARDARDGHGPDGRRRHDAGHAPGAGRRPARRASSRGGDVALVDPDLHADAAEGGPGLVEAVVDVRAQRVQRHATLAVELRAAHLGAAEAAGAPGPGCPWRRRAVADCMPLRMARRKETRAESCSAMPWATSWASTSGFLTSRMFSWTCLPVSFSSSPRMRSASAPRRPMTMPGRAVWMSTRTRSRVRSISTLGDAGALHALGHELADRDVFLDVVAVALPALVCRRTSGSCGRW